MKKKIMSLILASVMLAMTVSACGNSGTGDTASQTSSDGADKTADGEKAPAGDVQVVTVWSDNAHEQTIREAQVEEFNNTIGKEEGIQIDYTVYGSDYADVVNVALMANDGPDLFRPSSNTFAKYVSAGYAVPISDLEGSDSLLSKYSKDDLIIGDQVFDDKVYTLPYSLQSYKMIINQDLFDKAGIKEIPTTWDQVREDAKIITDASNGEAYGFFLALQSGWTLDHYIYSVSSAALGHFGYDAVSGTYKYSDGLPIVQDILGMIDDGSVFPGYENMDADTARAQFAAGRVGIVMAASFDVAVYTEQFPAECNWVVCDPPTIKEGGYDYKEMVAAVDLLGVAKKALDAKDTSKIARVLEWFYADENLVEMYEQGMYIPYRSEVLDIAGESSVKGWKEFSTFKDNQFIVRMADPKGVITYEGLSARETLAKLFSGGYSEDAATVLKDLDDRLNGGLKELDEAELKDYIAPSSYNVKRD
ncbi:ABC transporter substrate-binding protein [Butyrivibrio sp. INlla21]|uniref:ABC transporter substrate-binding protein n=1 Tax=Butyrivibrio sp. INlla21 TaxID=1520811 RepID=UPI0008F0B695|nr:extracellular solute-binding protein [Butyrivibrio sp. INlla21]SFU90275.1 extracellular solute-binding protein [Butyrivibrio sp. INlla21]